MARSARWTTAAARGGKHEALPAGVSCGEDQFCSKGACLHTPAKCRTVYSGGPLVAKKGLNYVSVNPVPNKTLAWATVDLTYAKMPLYGFASEGSLIVPAIDEDDTESAPLNREQRYCTLGKYVQCLPWWQAGQDIQTRMPQRHMRGWIDSAVGAEFTEDSPYIELSFFHVGQSFTLKKWVITVGYKCPK